MSGQQTSQTSQTQTQTANPQTQQAVGSILSQIPGLATGANSQYNSAMNQNVAGLTPQQLQAIQGLGGLAQNNPASPYISQAAQYSQMAADPNVVNANTAAYYNPMAQNVMAQLSNQFGQQSAQLLGNQAASGSIGGSRAAVANSTLANQQGLAAGQTLANLYNQAQQQAQTTAGQEASTAYTLGNLGNEALNTQLTGLNAGLQGGNQLQQQQQNVYNAATQNAIQSALYTPQYLSQLGNLSGIGSLLGGTTTGQGTTTTPVNMFGQILGAGIAGYGLYSSDERVKENVHSIGKTHDGQPLYRFNYIGDPSPRIGLMAQEVAKKHPDAVKEINGTKAVDYNKATAKSVQLGHKRIPRAIGGGVGIGNGVSGLAGYSGLQNPMQQYFGSPQVNVPQAHFPTLNLNPTDPIAAQKQADQNAQQMMTLGKDLGKTHIGSDINSGLGNLVFGSTPTTSEGGWSTSTQPSGGFIGGLQDYIGAARGGRIHRPYGGFVGDDPNSTQAANDAFLNNNQGFGWGSSIIPPAEAAIAPSNPWQPSIEGISQKPIQDRLPSSPPALTTMGSLSATPSSGQYYDLNDDGTRKGAPQTPPPISDPTKFQDRLPAQQASIASPAQAPAPIAAPKQAGPDWGDIPHTPQLANDRQRFAEELRQNPALRNKYLTISLQEQNDPTGNLAIFETAMNRASVNHTSLADELRMHNTEGGYYGGPYRPELLNNPRYRQMAEMNLERALSGSNVAKYGTDNSSGDFGRIRNSNGMYTPTAAYNGEYISYPSRPDARGYGGFPDWLNSVGGTIQGGLHDFAGSVQGGAQKFGQDVQALPGRIGEGVRGMFGSKPQSVLDRPDLQPPRPGESELDKRMAEFGFRPNQPQGLGGSLGRMLGTNPSMDPQTSNRLVNLGLGMMAAGPTVGVKGFPGAAINSLTNFGKGGQFALNQEQQERQQAIALANQAMQQKLHEAQIRHYNMESMKPFVAKTTAETVVDPVTQMPLGVRNVNHYAQFDENGKMHWVDEQTNNALNGQPNTTGGATQGTPVPPLHTSAKVLADAQAQGLTGEDLLGYLKDRSPADESYVRGILAGQRKMPEVTRSNPRAALIRDMVALADPGYDEARIKYRQEWMRSGSNTGKQRIANNAAISHMGSAADLLDQAKGVPDHDWGPLTSARNRLSLWWQSKEAEPWVSRWNANKKLLADEVSKVAAAMGNSALADRKENEDNLDLSKGKTALLNTLDQYQQLLAGKSIHGLQADWELNMGPYAPAPEILSPYSKKTLQKVQSYLDSTKTPEEREAGAIHVKSEDEARALIKEGKLRSGDTFIDENGVPRTVH